MHLKDFKKLKNIMFEIKNVTCKIRRLTLFMCILEILKKNSRIKNDGRFDRLFSTKIVDE